MMEHTVSLKLNKDFKRAYGKGKSAVAPSLVLYVRDNRMKKTRLGITVSTKVGKAVQRNKIRRRFREIYRLNEGKIMSGKDIVIVARHKSRSSGYWDLEADFIKAAGKLGILRYNEDE